MYIRLPVGKRVVYPLAVGLGGTEKGNDFPFDKNYYGDVPGVVVAVEEQSAYKHLDYMLSDPQLQRCTVVTDDRLIEVRYGFRFEPDVETVKTPQALMVLVHTSIEVVRNLIQNGMFVLAIDSTEESRIGYAETAELFKIMPEIHLGSESYIKFLDVPDNVSAIYLNCTPSETMSSPLCPHHS